jgi:glycerophosphoryl diester phosphodiesterase
VTDVFAHRGLHTNERENTLGAFLAARALGVDGVELDVRWSLDRDLVVHHDPAIDGRPIGRTSSRDLPDYVPTLAGALGTCAGLGVNVEIKNLRTPDEATYDETGDFARQVVSLVHEGGWADRTLISSFDLATCQAVRAFDESIYVAWLLWGVEIADAVATASAGGFNSLNPYVGVVTAAGVELARAAGLDLNVWTVNAPADLSAMFALKVASVITDDPATALALRAAGPESTPRPMA